MAAEASLFDPLKIALAGVHSIEASAGTGKTYTLATLYLRYLLEGRCQVEEILATTFTEAATAELKDRIRRRVRETLELLRRGPSEKAARQQANGDAGAGTLVRMLQQAGAWDASEGPGVRERLERAIQNFDRAPIFTIHGFCNRVLSELVFETASRFDVELVTSLRPFIHDALADFVAEQWASKESKMARWMPLDEKRWKKMSAVANAAAENPAFKIVPNPEGLPDLLASDLMERFDEAAEKLGKSWSKDRARIVERLLVARENKWLSGVSHAKENQLERAFDFLDLLAEERTPELFSLDRNGKIKGDQRRLSQTELEKGTKKEFKPQTPRHRVFKILDDLIALWQQINAHRERIRALLFSALAHAVREGVAERKQRFNAMSFGDMLHGVDAALGDKARGALLRKTLRARYRVALVDEFQDTDPVQYRIFRRIFQDAAPLPEEGLRAFIMIGDPKQSIYRFRGADIHSYLRARKRTPDGHRHTMDSNWRSDGSLVNAVQAVFASAKDPFRNEQIGIPKVNAHYADRFTEGPALEIVFVKRGEANTEDDSGNKDILHKRVTRCVAEEIVAQLNQPPTFKDAKGNNRALAPGDVAVLCGRGKQLSQMREALSVRGVPAVLRTGESIFDTPEASSMALVLQAMIASAHHRDLANALQTPVLGCSAADLQEIQQDEQRFSAWSQRFHRWQRLWVDRGFMAAWRQVLDEAETLPRLAGVQTGERQIANFLHLGELLHRHAASSHRGPTQTLRWLERMIAGKDRDDEDETQLRLETDAAAVQLCTIHKSKGLEYPFVYCPSLWDCYEGHTPPFILARFDENGQLLDNPEIDVGSDTLDQRKEQNKRELEAEERRKLYVALTRARHQCRVYWACAQAAWKTALGQLMHLPSPAENKKETGDDFQSHLSKWVKSLGAGRASFRIAKVGPPFQAPARYAPVRAERTKLTCRAIGRPPLSPLRQTSFSALSASLAEAADTEVADRDAVRGAAVSDHEPQAREARLPLADMPGGRKVGDLVHHVCEDLLGRHDLLRDDDAVRAAARERIGQDLLRVHLDPRWRDPLADAIAKGLSGTIQAGEMSCRLIQSPPAERACEFPFLLSVAGRDRAFDAGRIADAFALSERESVRAYAQRLRRIRAPRLHGFLAGFIDLVFKCREKWFLLDYKTNKLGAHPADYVPSLLERAMHEHDYYLQYHLYALALDRCLTQRVPGYAYERDFGGVVYLYLRGFDPASRERHGIYFDRPAKKVLDALSAALNGEPQP